MVREHVLTTDDLIWPLFIVDGENVAHAGCLRCRASSAFRSIRRCARPRAPSKLTIPCIALFPYTDPALRDEDGTEALNPDNLVCRAVRAIKKRGAGHRRPLRRRARSLYQPRP